MAIRCTDVLRSFINVAGVSFLKHTIDFHIEIPIGRRQGFVLISQIIFNPVACTPKRVTVFSALYKQRFRFLEHFDTYRVQAQEFGYDAAPNGGSYGIKVHSMPGASAGVA